MLIDLTEDTLGDLISQNDRSLSVFSILVRKQNNETKIQRLASENETIAFVLIDAENSPESRKLANVSNLLLLLS
jgi:hypothetical protein